MGITLVRFFVVFSLVTLRFFRLGLIFGTDVGSSLTLSFITVVFVVICTIKEDEMIFLSIQLPSILNP